MVFLKSRQGMIMPDTKTSGLGLLEGEMARQHENALASFRGNGEMAERIADCVRRNGRLLLVGMGASHYANRIAETEFRKLGIDAWAITAAELLQSPPPGKNGGAQTIILVSQSGESGEIVELLGQKPGEDWFGLTLDPGSALGRTLPCLVGAGGGEVAFAATRSLLVTLALHAAVLSTLRGGDAVDGLEHPALPSTADALATLGAKTSIVVSGGGALRGLAEANALMLMELARMPALGFEHGQFRHGPLELLSPDVGVLLLRGSGAEGAAVAGLARAALGAGSVPVVFDCSGEPAIPGVVTVPFPVSQGIAAALLMLPALQRLIIGISGKKVERVGEPLRSTKITRAEP
jgi:fructoselysine-6-P-deglycase FrlB-like protein